MRDIRPPLMNQFPTFPLSISSHATGPNHHNALSPSSPIPHPPSERVQPVPLLMGRQQHPESPHIPDKPTHLLQQPPFLNDIRNSLHLDTFRFIYIFQCVERFRVFMLYDSDFTESSFSYGSEEEEMEEVHFGFKVYCLCFGWSLFPLTWRADIFDKMDR